jgi:hypothetical protein
VISRYTLISTAQRAQRRRARAGRQRQDQREHADRTGKQHPVDDHDHRVGDAVRQRDHRLAAGRRQPGEGEREAEREHHQGCDRPLRRRGDHVDRHEGGDPLETSCLRRRRRDGAGRLDGGHKVAAPRAGGEQRRGDEGRKGRRGRCQEDDPRQRAPGDPATRRDIGRLGDADDDQRNDKGHDRHLQGMEPERTDRHGDRLDHADQLRRPAGEAKADRGPRHQPDENPLAASHRASPGGGRSQGCHPR